MAKGQYKKWLENDNLILLQGWKRNGLTDEQIANNIGVTPRTLENWKKKYVQIFRALKVGKEQANFAVEGKLLQRAMSGNTTAMIFWLKNNWRDKYNDSALSLEERETMKARKENIAQETRIKKLKADALERLGDSENGADDKTVIIDDIGGIDDGEDKT